MQCNDIVINSIFFLYADGLYYPGRGILPYNVQQRFDFLLHNNHLGRHPIKQFCPFFTLYFILR